MVWIRLFTVSSSSCCWCCKTVLLVETLRTCCSSLPMMAVCFSIRVCSCSFSSWNIFSSVCLCSSSFSTFFSRKLLKSRQQIQQRAFSSHIDPKKELLVTLKLFCCVIWCANLFLSFSLSISFVWTISCFSNLLVDSEFSRSCRSSRVVWWITYK